MNRVARRLVTLSIACLLACSGSDAAQAGGGRGQRASMRSADEGAQKARDRARVHEPLPEPSALDRARPIVPREPAQRIARPCPPADAIPEGTACVTGGAFVRGSDEGPVEEQPAAEIFVSTFLMDTHEVSNAQYAECVRARVCRRAMPFPGYMQDAQPALAMRWVDADAYCRWRERRLPTEAEWERAASGPGDTRYPWGDSVDDPCGRAVVRTREGRGCGRDATWPVGSRPPGPWGLYDMAGNVWEWVADHHARCYRGCARECGDACAGDDPRGLCGDPHAACPEARGLRTVRGGSWWYGVDRATTSARRGVPADNPNPHRFGFRCARDLGAAD